MLKPILRRAFIFVQRRFFRCTCFFRSRKYVLLACNSPLMADYLSEIYAILYDDARITFKLLLPDYEERPGAMEYMREMLPVPVIKYQFANVFPWDLIIIADHCWKELIDCKRNPCIFTAHGIDSGKIVGGEVYTFGSRALMKDGSRPRYSKMVAFSELERKSGILQTPALKDNIVVTGSLKIDKVLALMPQRSEIRLRRGFRPDDTVVLVMSTWGPNCLFRRMGDAILEQALNLKESFSFIFTMHPNEYRACSDSDRNWGDHLKSLRKDGFTVLDASEEFETSIVACDVILTDHTSAALYGVVVGRPFIYVPCVAGCVEEGSLVWRLKQISPVIRDDAADMYERILEARDHYQMDKLAEIAHEIHSFPGEAAARTRHEIHKLLKIDNK